MKIDAKKILPKDPSVFTGYPSVRVLLALYMFVIVVRSCIHFFSSDGGANSIAGIDISVEGGDNIIAIFPPMGSDCSYCLCFCFMFYSFKYPGLTPLIASDSCH